MEEPVDFKNGTQTLRGILHLPDGTGGGGPGVVFLHGWSGCRLGPHRMFVHAARELTGMGVPCLRFDFGGRGDSDGNPAEACIGSMISDAGKAMDFLVSRTEASPIVLLGICSAGKVAIGRAADDARVGGLALWSCEPMGNLRDARADTRRSFSALGAYSRKLLRPETWVKMLTFRVNTRMVRKAMFEHERASDDEVKEETGALARFERFRGKALFIYGSNDPETRQAAQSYSVFCRQHGVPGEFREIVGANHSFYSLKWEREVLDLTRRWVAEKFG